MKTGKLFLSLNYLLTLWSIVNYVDYFDSGRRFSYFNVLRDFVSYTFNLKITFIHLLTFVIFFFILLFKMINSKKNFISKKIAESNISLSLTQIVNYKGIDMKYYQLLFLGPFLIYFIGLQLVSEFYNYYGMWYIYLILGLTIPQYFLMRKFLSVSFFKDISSTLDILCLLSSFFLFFSFTTNDNGAFILVGIIIVSLILFISIIRFQYNRKGILGEDEDSSKERANYPLISMIFITLLQFITLFLTYTDLNSIASRPYLPQGNIYFEVASYIGVILIVIGIIDLLADKIDIIQLKKFYSTSVAIAALLLTSFFIIDDLWFAVNSLFDFLYIFGNFGLFILPTGIASGFEMAIIKRKVEL